MKINKLDFSSIEDKINSNIPKNMKIDDIAIFGEVTESSYIVIDSCIDNHNMLRISNNNKYSSITKFYIGSKRQFLYDRYTVSSNTHMISLSNKMKTAWNPNKFLIFRNRLFVNSNLYKVVIPDIDNDYLYKQIYFAINLMKDDILDIYYIESDEDYSKLPISKDIYLSNSTYVAETDNQTVIKIPYPDEYITKSVSSFYIFNKSGSFLNSEYDYTISENGEYITLTKENRLKKNGIDYIIFTFPHTSNMDIIDDRSKFGKISTNRFVMGYSKIVDPNTGVIGLALGSGIVLDQIAELTKKNTLLFGNNNLIDHSKYEISSIGYTGIDIVLTDADEKASCQNKKYVIIINNETDNSSVFYSNPEYTIIGVEAEYDNQMNFNIPLVSDIYKDFIVYTNRLIFYSQSTNIRVNDTTKTITLLNDYKTIVKGQIIYFIFIKPKSDRFNDISRFNIIEFKVEKDQPMAIPNDAQIPELSLDNFSLFMDGKIIDDEELLEDIREELSDNLVSQLRYVNIRIDTKREVISDIFKRGKYEFDYDMKRIVHTYIRKMKYDMNPDDDGRYHIPIKYYNVKKITEAFPIWISPTMIKDVLFEINAGDTLGYRDTSYFNFPINKVVLIDGITTIDNYNTAKDTERILYMYLSEEMSHFGIGWMNFTIESDINFYNNIWLLKDSYFDPPDDPVTIQNDTALYQVKEYNLDLPYYATIPSYTGYLDLLPSTIDLVEKIYLPDNITVEAELTLSSAFTEESLYSEFTLDSAPYFYTISGDLTFDTVIPSTVFSIDTLDSEFTLDSILYSYTMDAELNIDSDSDTVIPSTVFSIDTLDSEFTLDSILYSYTIGAELNIDSDSDTVIPSTVFSIDTLDSEFTLDSILYSYTIGAELNIDSDSDTVIPSTVFSIDTLDSEFTLDSILYSYTIGAELNIDSDSDTVIPSTVFSIDTLDSEFTLDSILYSYTMDAELNIDDDVSTIPSSIDPDIGLYFDF